MGVQTQLLCGQVIEAGVIFIPDGLVDLFVVLHVLLLALLSNEAYQDMRQEEAVGDEVWWDHLRLGSSIAIVKKTRLLLRECILRNARLLEQVIMFTTEILLDDIQLIRIGFNLF